MVSHHGCIRVVKQALALKARGHWVEILTQHEPFAFNRFDRVTMWHDAAQLTRGVWDSHADIVHVHNEPDWLVSAARAGTSRPVIFDIHDLDSLRMQAAPSDEERAAFAAADGYVHVSEPCRVAAERAHPAHTEKPATVLPCYVNAEFYSEVVPRSSPDCLVYEGGLSVKDDVVEHHGQAIVNIRNLRPLVGAAVSAGLQVGLCPGTALTDHTYENLGAAVWGPLPYPVMLRSLRPYGWGFVGACANIPLMQAAMPNKLFEYLSQGVVPVVYQADTAAAFVRTHGIGVVLASLAEWAPLWEADHAALRQRVIETRDQWTMERHIGAVEQLYHDVLARASRPQHLTANDDLGVPV